MTPSEGLFTKDASLSSVVQNLIFLINLCVGVLATLALVVFFYGIVKYLYHSNDSHELAEGRKSMMWGLIALFVLFSVFGILQLLNIAFFGGSSVSGSYSADGQTLDSSGLNAIH